MHSSRMRTVHCSGCLSCHACPLPCMPPAMHAPCHACPLPCMPPAMHTHPSPLSCTPPSPHMPCPTHPACLPGQNSWHYACGKHYLSATQRTVIKKLFSGSWRLRHPGKDEADRRIKCWGYLRWLDCCRLHTSRTRWRFFTWCQMALPRYVV